MSKGRLYPKESRLALDERTGVSIRQVTSAPAIHHHPFFMIPAYDDAMQWTIFVSERTGAPQIFAEVRATGELLQLTDRPDLSDWSIHPSHDGKYVYFTAGTGGWRVNISTLEEEQLIDLGDVTLREEGMVAAAMGTTALSTDDRWWAIKFNVGSDACLSITNTQTGKSEIILRRDTISHLQFCPDDPGLIFYAGPLTDRVWVINRDGTGNRRLARATTGITKSIAPFAGTVTMRSSSGNCNLALEISTETVRSTADSLRSCKRKSLSRPPSVKLNDSGTFTDVRSNRS